jgi:Rrf2 family protein
MCGVSEVRRANSTPQKSRKGRLFLTYLEIALANSESAVTNRTPELLIAARERSVTLLSRKADYALLILSYLHQHKTGGTARAVADQFGLSRPFVANILKQLCQQKLVVSHRGVKGGYSLARDAASVTLADLLEAVEEDFRLTVCNTSEYAEDTSCEHAATCTVKGPLGEVHARLVGVLRGVSLAELFDPSARPTVPVMSLTVLNADAGGCAAPPVESFPA